MSKKFEYELTLRLEKAEKAIASLASKIEKDLGKAVNTAFKESSYFDVAKQDLDKMIASARLLHENQKEASQFTLKLEQDRLGVVRERIQMEMNAADEAMRDAFERRQAESNLQAKEDSARAEKQRGLEKAFSGGVPLDVKESEELRAIRNIAAEKQKLRGEETEREIQAYEGEKGRAERLEAERLAAVKERLDKQDKLDDAALQESLARRQAEADIEAKHAKEREDKQKMYNRLFANDADEQIRRIKAVQDADSAAAKVRYKDHYEVLIRVEEAEKQNAADRIALEQRVTTMTKQEAKEQTDAFRKLAKARIDAAVDAGYKMEALNANHLASGAKGVSAIFQVQQGIEDAMYAGLRGAGNNIAFLLTKVTSSWVAIGGLIGVATFQLMDHLGVFKQINEASDGLFGRTEKQLELEKQLAELRAEDYDRTTQQLKDQVSFSPSSKTPEKAAKEIEDKKKVLEIEKQRLEQLKDAIAKYDKIKQLEAAPYFSGQGANSQQYLKQLEASRAAAQELRAQFAALGIEFTVQEDDYKAMEERLKQFRSDVAKTTDELKVYEDQLKAVQDAGFRKSAMEWVKQETLDMLDQEIERSKDVVKAREEELRTVQQTLATAEQLLKTEQNREDAIRKAASAREDEFAKQKLGLQNTILDMEASETAKAEKAKADSAKEAVASQMDSHRKWAEKQAQIDKFNNKGNSANIDAAKQNWLSNMQAQADAEIARIEANEKRAIESAKKVAEEAKKANLDAMEVVQKKKVEDLLEEAKLLKDRAGFIRDPSKAKEMDDDAQEALDKAQKTLKEMADAKVGNLNQKDSVQQGKDALREWEELTKQVKEVDKLKEEFTKRAQEGYKNRALSIKAEEDQAAARLETVKEQH